MTIKTSPPAKAPAWVGKRPDAWWTGKRPVFGECPGMTSDGRLHSLLQLQLTSPTRQEFLDYFDNGWTLTELLFSSLQGVEAFVRSPVHGLRHPMIFYYGHVAVLYVNKMRLAGLLPGPVDEELEQYLEVGVDEMSWDDLSKNEKSWPSVERVHHYRKQVYDLIKNVIKTHPALESARAPFLENSPVWCLAMGFEHERIHFETSSVLIRELPIAFVRRPEAWPKEEFSTEKATPTPPAWCSIAAGTARLGKARMVPSFGWDNEYGDRVVDVPAFQTTSCLISNQEFLDFVSAGGYRESRYWSDEGWRWKLFRNAKWPTFWIPEGPSAVSGFKLRRIFDVVSFEATLPAIVNFYEAQAYGAWRAEKDGASSPYRLTSEVEQHRLRQYAGSVVDGNLDLKYGSETPVSAFVREGIGDAYGNVWQWCEDEANPLPGFSPHPYYEDFSTPCFDGKHQMILGGSFISTGDEASAWARFHFRPHFFQHAGFRLVKNSSGSNLAAKISVEQAKEPAYENETALAQYMELHYGEKDNSFPYEKGPQEALGFPRRCAGVVLETARRLKLPLERALDLGCAVGGATFELARGYSSVTGVDLSGSFIQQAQQMKETGRASYVRAIEGQITEPHEAKVPSDLDRSRVTFLKADASQLPPELHDFDTVLMANLLCRLPHPRKALEQLSGSLLKKGGLLVLASPYSWIKDYTPEEQWIGGRLSDGKTLRSRDVLVSLLSPQFELLQEENVPLLIREHARKFQYIVSHLMVWQKR